jgi:hypothetical protein
MPTFEAESASLPLMDFFMKILGVHDVKLGFSSTAGRYLVAAAPRATSTLLVREPPFAHMLDQQKIGSCCFYCGRNLGAPLISRITGCTACACRAGTAWVARCDSFHLRTKDDIWIFHVAKPKPCQPCRHSVAKVEHGILHAETHLKRYQIALPCDARSMTGAQCLCR